MCLCYVVFFFSSRRRHTRSLCDWSSDVCSSDLISGPSEESTDKYVKIDKIIPKLIQEIDYTIDEKHRTATLTEEGVSKRSEERRVGKECRSRRARDYREKKQKRKR